ncbi:MAG: GNAT family N-acetyltransferase [Oscillospiraceae bacterium]|nr:GNAT family N-acetyltransferase [Oscillospiraceae bacterium]
MIQLQTERLTLRNLQEEDGKILYAYRNDPECSRYQRWEDTSLPALECFVKTFSCCAFPSEEEEQHYALCLGEMLIGDVSCFYTQKDSCFTLGITMATQYHHQGYAREILGAMVAVLKARYPKREIVALIDPENAASIALFEALGFVRECYAESIRSCVYVI